MGGVGKTELALQYAIDQLHQGQYPAGICWLRARDREIATEIVNFAQVHLGLSLPDQMEIEDQVGFCWQRWPQGEALVVLDDVTDYQAIAPYLPPADPRFKLLITTRLDLGSTVQKIAIEELDEESAIALLESLVGVDRVRFSSGDATRTQLADAQALCQWVGYLPLALELLGRFLARKLDWSISRLHTALENKRLAAKALVKTENGMTGSLGVAAALELSWQELNDAEQELACLLGMFAIAPIPWSLVKSCQPEVEPDDLEDTRDNGLMARNLLKRVDKGIYQLHQIVQEYFRIKLEERAKIKVIFCQEIVEIAKTINPIPLIDEIQLVRENIIHLEETTRSWIDNVNDESLIWLFLAIGDFYEGQGYYSSAEHWRQCCLEVTQQRFGEKHRDVATSQRKLGVCLESQGKYQEAELCYRSALEMRQHLLGNDHLDVATSMSDLAVLYKLQGKYQESEFFHLSALTIYHHLLEKEHEFIASSRNNLAELYRCQQRYGEAEFLYLSALEISQCLLEPNYLSIAIIHNNLALLYCSQGEYRQAKSSYISSLEIYQHRLEKSHPDIATIYNNLALFYFLKGEYGEAESLYLAALEIYQHRLGGSHPDITTIQWNLGALYQNQSRYPEAEDSYHQALAIAQSKLGSNHPTTQGILNSLNSLPQAPA